MMDANSPNLRHRGSQNHGPQNRGVVFCGRSAGRFGIPGLVALCLLWTGCAGGGGTAPVAKPIGKDADREAVARTAGTDRNSLELQALLLMMADQRFLDPVSVASAAIAGPDLRRKLAFTLGRVGDPRGGPTLQSLAADEDPRVRRAAVFALGELGEKGHPEAVNTLLGAAADEDFETGRLAVEGLGKSGVTLDKVVQRLLDAPNGEILSRLMPSLFRFDSPAAVRWARQALEEPDAGSDLRAMAAYGVARNPRPEALELIRTLTHDDDPWVRGLAARALGRIGDASDLPALRVLIDDSQPGPVIHALRSARSIIDSGQISAPDDWRPRMLELLDDPRPDVRVTAVEASTAWLLDEDLAERLEGFTISGSAREKELAITALAEAGDPRAQEGLAKWAKAEDPVLRTAVLRAAALGAWLEPALAGVEDEVPGVRAAAYEVLLEATDQFEEMAADILADDDYVVRATVLAWASRRPVLRFEVLAQAFEEARLDREPDVRLAAIRALKARAEDEVTEKGGILAVLEKIAGQADYLSRREASAALSQLGGDPPKLGKFASRRTVEVYRAMVARTAQPVRYRMSTDVGDLVLELACPDAPLTCLSFQQLADQGFYDGLRFHRIVPDFVVQGGDPRGDGAGGPGYTLRDEINHLRYETGALGMAHAGPDTAGSQFFITITPQPHLDGGYTVFGRVVEGLPLLRKWMQGQEIRAIRRVGDAP